MPRIAITVMGVRCERCEYEWVPRSGMGREPKVCPRCKSPYWNRPRYRTAAYEAFADSVAAVLHDAGVPLTWAEIRNIAGLAQAFPNENWIEKLETEIGLKREKDAQGTIRWHLEAGGETSRPEESAEQMGVYDALEARLRQLLGRSSEE